MNSESTVWEHELPEETRATMEHIRSRPVPPESLERVLGAAANLDQPPHGNPASQPTVTLVSTLLTHSRTLAAIAATLIVALSAAFVMLSQNGAWAQVVEAVAKQPWMRLTLQKPADGMPVGEEFPEVTMWFSGDRKTAACSAPDGVRWVDLGEGNAFRFDPTTGRVDITKLDAQEGGMVQTLVTVLVSFEADVTSIGGTNQELLGSSAQQMTIDGETFVEFTFRIEQIGVTPPQQTMLVRVNQETHRPVSLTIYRGTPHDKLCPANFAIDYPASGATDIYALGVPKDAPVDDLRSLAKFFRERPAIIADDYEAIELMFLSGKERKWVSGAYRYGMHDGVASAETADLMQVNDLAQKVYFGDGDTPTGNTPEIAWWLAEVSRLRFEGSPMQGNNFPHNRCYMPYGGVDGYRTGTRRSWKAWKVPSKYAAPS